MKTVFPILATLLFAVLLLACPAAAGTAVQDALTLCVRTVIPSLFPFFIVTGLLVQFGLDSILRPLCQSLFPLPMDKNFTKWVDKISSITHNTIVYV